MTGNDVGAWLSNADGSFNPPASATNIKVVNNTISNPLVTNISGCFPLAGGYQAGVSDQGNNDKIITNSISGAGYAGTGPCIFGIDQTVTNKAKVHANVLTN